MEKIQQNWLKSMGLLDRFNKVRGNNTTIDTPLHSAFMWKTTTEGHKYWAEISSIIRNWINSSGTGEWNGRLPGIIKIKKGI